MTDRSTDTKALRRFLLVAALYPLVAVGLAVTVQLLTMGDVPDPMATHWGADGRPDGFAPPWTSVVLTAVLGLGIPALLTAATAPAMRRGARGSSYRALGVVAASMATLLSVLPTWLMLSQRGLSDAAGAPDIWAPLAVSFAATAVVAVAAWFIQPEQRSTTTSTPAASIDLAPGERAVWIQEASARTPLLAIAGMSSGALVLGTIVAWLRGGLAVAIPVTLLLAVVLIALATTMVFHVRVDGQGLTVTSIAGLPRYNVAIEDVTSVATTQVNAVGDFGGFGLRSRKGAFGVITQSGPAIDVTRRSGRRFVVTIPNAEQGAALLSTLADSSSTP